MYSLYVAVAVYRFPLPYDRRTVESFGYLPRVPSLLQSCLHVAGSEIDAYRYGIVVSMGKPHGYALAQTAYPHHELCLMVYASHFFRQEKRLAVLQQCRVGFGKYHRLGSALEATSHLFVVLGIVHAYGKNLHCCNRFYVCILSLHHATTVYGYKIT